MSNQQGSTASMSTNLTHSRPGVEVPGPSPLVLANKT